MRPYFWKLALGADAQVCVAPVVAKATSYILLEQEDWFEDEIRFVRKLIEPGMRMLDIGANHGVYSLAAASRIGDGHIWAFEPTHEPRALFGESIAANGWSSAITLVPAGLSDSERRAEMVLGATSELNSLHGPGANREEVLLLTLDGCAREHFPGSRIDFVKLDAEGEEVAILRGGARFFAEQSPLVMFELRHGNAVNDGLVEAFRAAGYDLYILVPEAGVLIPWEGGGVLLNLFACKPDCAARLQARGLLAKAEADLDHLPLGFVPSPDLLASQLESLPFLRPWLPRWPLAAIESLPPAYVMALSAAIAAGAADTPPLHRIRLWRWAAAMLSRVGEDRLEVDLLRLHLLYRLGALVEAVALASKLEERPEAEWRPEWPVLPPLSESRAQASRLEMGAWARFRVFEFRTIKSVFSSGFELAWFASRVPVHIMDPDRCAMLERSMLLLLLHFRRRPAPSAPTVDPRNRAVWSELLDGLLD